MKLYTNLHDSA